MHCNEEWDLERTQTVIPKAPVRVHHVYQTLPVIAWPYRTQFWLIVIFVLELTDAFSLDTIFITQPPPSRQDRYPDKGSDVGAGNKNQVCHDKRSAALGNILTLTDTGKHTVFKMWFTLHQFLTCPLPRDPIPCLSLMPLSLSPVPEHWALRAVLCLSFRHQTTIDRDSILSPPQPAPHKTLIARKLWRTQIAPARMSCKPHKNPLFTKTNINCWKEWKYLQLLGPAFHYSYSKFLIFFKSSSSLYEIIKTMTSTCLLWSNYSGIERLESRGSSS